MRFLIDTNILLYAVNRDSPEQPRARAFLAEHLAKGTPWCLTFGVLYEFLRVATHPRIFPRPLAARDAFRFVRDLVTGETVTILQPTARHLDLLEKTLSELSHPTGNLFHDIRTAVILREHGVREIITADTDFLQFPFLQVMNPLAPGKD